MAVVELAISKNWFTATTVQESNWDRIRNPLMEWADFTNRNLEQIATDCFGVSYSLDNDGAANLSVDLQTQINNILSGATPFTSLLIRDSTTAGATVTPFTTNWRSPSPATSDVLNFLITQNSSTTNDAIQTQLQMITTDVTHGTRSSAFIIFTMNSGTLAERLRVGANGDTTITGNLIWGSGIGNNATFDHANAGARVYTFQDATDTVVMRATTDTLSGKTFSDNLVWQSGQGAVNTGTLDHANTGARVYTFQDSSDTIVGRATTDTLSGKTFSDNIVWQSGTAFTCTLDHANAANRIITVPDAAGNMPVLPTAATTETGADAIVRTTSPTIVTPTIADFTNATHSHQNPAGGGTLDAAAIASGTLVVGRGGTGATTFTANGILYGNTTGAIQVTAQGAAGTVLHGNAGIPSFSAVSLTADVTGVLPVANGGSGAGTYTANGVILGNGTSAFNVTSVGATGTVLKGNTGAQPTYGSVLLTTDVTGTLAVANGGTGVTTSTGTTNVVLSASPTLSGTVQFSNGFAIQEADSVNSDAVTITVVAAQTNNNTVQLYSRTLGADETYTVYAIVCGRDGIAATNFRHVAILGGASRYGGAGAVLETNAKLGDADDGTYTVNMTVSGNDMRVTVVSSVAETHNWVAEVRAVRVT